MGILGAPENGDNVDKINSDKYRLDLLRVILDCLPRFSPVGVTPSRLLEMLSYFLLHANEAVREAAAGALGRISAITEPITSGYSWKLNANESLASAIYRISTQTVTSVLLTRYSDLWTSSNGDPSKTLIKFATIYVNSLNLWLDDIKGNIELNQNISQKEIESIIQSIEARGLLFLIQGEPQMRLIADQVFKLASDFRKILNFHRDKNDNNILSDPANVTYSRLVSFHGIRNSIVHQRNSHLRSVRRMSDIFKDLEFELVAKHFNDPQPSESIISPKQRQRKHDLLTRKRPLLHVCTSMEAQESGIWNRCIPDLLRGLLMYGSRGVFSNSIIEALIIIRELHPLIKNLADPYLQQNTIGSSFGTIVPKNSRRPQDSKKVASNLVSDALIDHWKNYLLFVCLCSESDELGSDAASSSEK